MKIGIVGAGHAGMEAALAARHAGAEVTIFSAEAVPPYFRPRLISVAMGQVAPEAVAMHPAPWYAEQGIGVQVATPVRAIQVATRSIVTDAGSFSFDALVLACGARPRRPTLRGESPATPLFTLWNMADALAIRNRIRPGARLVVLGGSCLGVETALRAREQQLHVTLVEQMPRLMPMMLGVDAGRCLQQQMESKGIALRTGQAVAGVSDLADGVVCVQLSDGSQLLADLLVICIGALPDVALAGAAGLPLATRGIRTDACLQAAPGVFVAGDVCAAQGVPARGAVREANAQGRLAGANAVASVSGDTLHPFASVITPLSVRCGGVEVNVAGQVAGDGQVECRLDDGSAPGVVRAVVRQADGSLAGVQMIGTREGFDELVAQIR